MKAISPDTWLIASQATFSTDFRRRHFHISFSPLRCSFRQRFFVAAFRLPRRYFRPIAFQLAGSWPDDFFITRNRVTVQPSAAISPPANTAAFGYRHADDTIASHFRRRFSGLAAASTGRLLFRRRRRFSQTR